MKLTAKRPETTIEFCLDGSLYAEHQAVEAELTLARRKALGGDKRLNDPTAELSRKVVDLEDLMRAESVRFRFRGLPRKDWTRLTAENPPRPDNKLDATYGFNIDDLMVSAIPASIVGVEKDGEPVEFDPASDWEALADDMTDRQYEDFVVAVLFVNRGRQEVPFSQAAYRQTHDSEQT